MTKKDIFIARQFKKRLSKITNVIDFRVFGSRVERIPDKYSDIDIFIEVKQLDKKLKDKILHIAWEIGFNNSMVISPLIFEQDEIENTPAKSSDIVLNILEDGIAL